MKDEGVFIHFTFAEELVRKSIVLLKLEDRGMVIKKVPCLLIKKKRKRSVLSKVVVYYTVFKQSHGILPYLVPVL